MESIKRLLFDISVTYSNSDHKVILVFSVKIKTSKITLKNDWTHQFLKYNSNETDKFVNIFFSRIYLQV